MTRMMSIDPGEVHCGTASWLDGSCYSVEENGPGQLFWRLEKALRAGSLDVVVMEEFRLYPWKSKEQGFSQLRTVEVIGVITYLVARWGTDSVRLVTQPATIKRPTEGHMRAKNIENRAVAEKKGPHCKDAVLHGQYFVMYGDKDKEQERK